MKHHHHATHNHEISGDINHGRADKHDHGGAHHHHTDAGHILYCPTQCDDVVYAYGLHGDSEQEFGSADHEHDNT